MRDHSGEKGSLRKLGSQVRQGVERPQGGKIYPSSDPGDLEINRAPFGREAQES